MSKREFILRNKQAREMSEIELTQILYDYFREVKGKDPNLEQEAGLRDAAKWVRGNEITWSRVERGIADETWDPAEGPRALLSQGG